MEDKNQTLWDKRKETREAYKEGVSEGWDQARWAIIAVAIIVVLIAQYFPD